MKKLSLLLLVVGVLAMSGSVAFALDPTPGEDTPFTFYERSGETGIPNERWIRTGAPTTYGWSYTTATLPPEGFYGASRWWYKDSMDTTAKSEGSYLKFDLQTHDATNGVPADTGLYVAGAAARDVSGPHGGYDTTTNKCKVCHAVHRASGAFSLLRVDHPDDSCNYCHIGSHRHSRLAAYWQAGSIYAHNGHTMGAGKEIPDSSRWQWVESKTLRGGQDLDGDGIADDTQTINVRRYEPQRYRLHRHARA